MRRLSIALLSGVLAVALTATAAQAVSPHLKGRRPVSVTDGGLTLSATVSYAGLGNFDTFQELTATGNATSTCTNSGGNQAPGQNPAPTTTSGGTAIPKEDIKNGNVTISTTTGAPVTPIPGAPGCPNPNWTEDITDIAFTSATIKLSQNQDTTNPDFETLVLTVNCTFNPPTSDGSVPSSGFTCTV